MDDELIHHAAALSQPASPSERQAKPRPSNPQAVLPHSSLSQELTVFVVAAESPLRDALTLTLAERGFSLRHFQTRKEFLTHRTPGWRGVILADLNAPASDNFDFLRRGTGKKGTEFALPVILSGQATPELVRLGFLAGAVDVLPTPIGIDELLAALHRGMALLHQKMAAEPVPQRSRRTVMDVLTPREREVAGLVRQGFNNRSIGEQLAISHRTVEVHKARLMRKLEIRTLAELMVLPKSHPRKPASKSPRNSARRGV